jgi:gamma-glutamyltranspeptidase/glutathione hydrolase
MIATTQPLAAAAGLRVLQHGGNAIDAAVTAAAVLAVVEPTMNGIGGDLFALVYDPGRAAVRALNASGRSSYRATADAFRKRGLDDVPLRGVLSITVPGVVDGWAELLEHHGTIGFEEALGPAIEHARRGYPVAEIVSGEWLAAVEVLQDDPAAACTFLPGGSAPAPGELCSNPELATSLELIASGGRDAFYRGAIAEAIVADLRQRGGLLDLRDFGDHRSDWVEPIGTRYRGYDILEHPPNTQGLAVLEMLNILEAYDLGALGHNSADHLHLLIEAKRLAYADRDAILADPASVPPDVVQRLVSKEYGAERRRLIDRTRASLACDAGVRLGQLKNATPPASRPTERAPDRGDTTYLTVADGHGNVISLIQSLYESFGSGIVAGPTGIALHNRGSLFTLKDRHPNQLAPHKRPFHTLLPAMVMKDGRPWLSFGVTGGDLQAHGHVQILTNLIDFGMNVQEAGEAARVRSTADGLALESGISEDTRSGLNGLGHTLIERPGVFGGFQGILIDPATSVFNGGSDPRKDGLAIGY